MVADNIKDCMGSLALACGPEPEYPAVTAGIWISAQKLLGAKPERDYWGRPVVLARASEPDAMQLIRRLIRQRGAQVLSW